MPAKHTSVLEPRIVIVEKQRAVQNTVRGFLEDNGYQVEVFADLQPALDSMSRRPAHVVLAGAEAPDRQGETFCRRLKVELSSRVPVVLLYSPGEEDADRRANAVEADGYLVAPLKKHFVLTVTKAMLRVKLLLDQLDEQEEAMERVRAQAVGTPSTPASTRPKVEGATVYDFEFLKKLLLMEVKRSKRYAYPISLAIVAFDGVLDATADMDAPERARVLGSLLAQIALSVRDIDLPVLYAEDKALVFMPHTTKDGAMVVGGRLRDRLREHIIDCGDDTSIRITGSIGIASFDGQGKVSFGGLIKNALTAMRKVQGEGGDGLQAVASETVKSRVSIG